MNTLDAASLSSTRPVAGTPGCPHCGLELPLPRPVLAARLRCPSVACAARLRIRAGRVLSA